MKRSDVTNYFLQNRTFEGAPQIKPLTSLDELKEGSIIFRPDRFRTGVYRIEVHELERSNEGVKLIKGKYSAETEDSFYFTAFSEERNVAPKHHLRFQNNELEGIYHYTP